MKGAGAASTPVEAVGTREELEEGRFNAGVTDGRMNPQKVGTW